MLLSCRDKPTGPRLVIAVAVPLALGCGRVGYDLQRLGLGGDAPSSDAGHDNVRVDAGGGSSTGGTAGSSGSAGSNMVTGDCVLDGAVGPTGYATGEIAELVGPHLLTVVASGRCAQPRGCSIDPASMEQSTCSNARCQLWHCFEIEPTWFVLTNLANGGCLDVGNGSTAEGATIQAFPCNALEHQRWQAVCTGSDQWKIVNKKTALLLGVRGDTDGALVQQWLDVDADTERWQIESQPMAYLELLPTSESAGQSFRYTISQPAAGWQDAGFDDTAWQEGLAPFGTRFGDPWAPRTDWASTDIWLRKSVTLASVPDTLDIRIFSNGPAQVYLNGTLAVDGSVSIGYRVVSANAAAVATLTQGVNTLAVHVARNAVQDYGQFIDVGLGELTWR